MSMSPVRVKLVVASAAVVIAAVLGFGELTHWRASRRRLGNGTGVAAVEAVVVLGYRNASGRANYLNRLAARLRRGEDYRFGEMIVVKPFAAVVGLRSLRSLRRQIAGHAPDAGTATDQDGRARLPSSRASA